jgi:hypothetical protein
VQFTLSFIFSAFLGLPDEVHNGLIDTYHLHKQEHKLFRTEQNSKKEKEGEEEEGGGTFLSSTKMIRCVPLKVYAAAMSM